ncbi:hypothetical protein Hanom_Chr13g01213431 [Helianthus anomalus]
MPHHELLPRTYKDRTQKKSSISRLDLKHQHTLSNHTNRQIIVGLT